MVLQLTFLTLKLTISTKTCLLEVTLLVLLLFWQNLLLDQARYLFLTITGYSNLYPL